ncbi:MAG: pyridoxal phosphate-dependent aminotransferase [Candidatus Hodarchaeota archaeon]
MVFFSKHMEAIPPSATLKTAQLVFQLERQGIKVVRLDAGQPDFDTPDIIKNAAIQALKEGFTKYTSSRGIIELREAIAKRFEKEGVEIAPEKNVIVTPGAKFAVLSSLFSTIEPGDQVIIPTPSWVSYSSMIKMAGGIPIPVKSPDTKMLDENEILENLNYKTKMILVGSPCNPTGNVLTEEEQKFLRDTILDEDLFLLSDEIYRELYYTEKKPKTMLSHEGLHDNLITIDGFSKSYSMTGWRLGYAIGSKKLIDLIDKYQQNSTTHPASFVQKAGIVALNEAGEEVEKMRNVFKQRRDMMMEILEKTPEIECITPKGAFYSFPHIKNLKIDSYAFAHKLLETKNISIIPGDPFGPGGEHHIRVSFATSSEQIKEGLKRLVQFIKEKQ